jgi:hypothetical protein
MPLFAPPPPPLLLQASVESPKRAALRFDGKLQQAAQAHSEDMAIHNKLTHQWSRRAPPAAPPASGWQLPLASSTDHS